MAWLANHVDGGPHASVAIAAGTLIPDTYLSKILRRLVVAGLLESKKGRHGGFQLSRSADDISFQQVLQAVGSLPEVGVCIFGFGRCDIDNPCSLHTVWVKYVEHADRWARVTNLGDIGPCREVPEFHDVGATETGDSE